MSLILNCLNISRITDYRRRTCRWMFEKHIDYSNKSYLLEMCITTAGVYLNFIIYIDIPIAVNGYNRNIYVFLIYPVKHSYRNILQKVFLQTWYKSLIYKMYLYVISSMKWYFIHSQFIYLLWYMNRLVNWILKYSI